MKKKLIPLLLMSAKYSSIGILFQCLVFSIVFASNGNAQKVLSVKEVVLELEFNNVRLPEVFSSIESLTNYEFVYHTNDINPGVRFSMPFSEISVADLLLKVSAEANIAFKQHNLKISVKKLEGKRFREKDALEILIQTRTVTGKVTSSDDPEGLPGVNVIEKGTSNGTVTNLEGVYTLQVAEGATLVFSSVGYVREEIVIGNRSVVDLSMTMDIKSLQEIVVVGYGVQKVTNVTGSIATVRTDQISAVPMPSLAQGIMGRAPGMFIKNVNGQPGETKLSYNIRGYGNPLLIIDGMPATDNDFRQLDPNDIQDFTILKDAGAAAVYGARAGNGVILIKTKRGEVSEPQFSYTGNYGVQFITMMPDFVSSEMYARMENLSRYNQGLTPIHSDSVINLYANGTSPAYPNTNWKEESLRNYAPQMQHNLNVRGGTDKVKYFVSGGYFYQEAMTKVNDTDYNKYTLRSNLDLVLSKKLNMSLDLSVLYQDFTGPSSKMERTGTTNGIMGKIYRSRPMFAAQYPDPTKLPTMGGGDDAPTVYTIDNVGYNKWNNFNGDAKVAFSYSLPYGFEAKANYRLYKSFNNRKEYYKKTPTYKYDWNTNEYTLVRYLSNPSRLYERSGINNNFDQQYFLTWDKKINDHSFGALAVYEVLSRSGSWFEASRRDGEFPIEYLFAWPDQDKDNLARPIAPEGRVGLINNLNYAYKDKYLIEMNSRYDASSRFPKDTRWGFFPSVALGWRMSQEPFIGDFLPFVNELKLRGSHGKLGYDDTGNYQFLETFSVTSQHIFDDESKLVAKGIKADALPNPFITWEKMASTNVGLDFNVNLFNSSLEGSVDYFYRLRTDVLGARLQSIPNIVGATMPNENYAKYDNRGVDFVLNFKSKIGDVAYTIGGNASLNREKAVFIDQSSYATDEAYRRGNRIGEWTDRTWGLKSMGLFQSKEEIETWADQDGRNNATVLPGDVKFWDYNGDGRITDEDQIIIGRGVMPKLMYGLNGSFSWKGFDLNMLWQGAGLYDFNLGSAPDYRLVFYAGNTPMMHMLTDSYVPEGNPWLPANTTNAKYPLYRTDDYNRSHRSFGSSDFWLINGSYIRLKALEFGYTIPKSVVGRLGIEQFKIYLSGYNLLTFSALDFIDPEVDTSPARVMGDYYPPVGTYNLGVLIQF
jgi:TonB-linked SusC/RagA family outer membrane protein